MPDERHDDDGIQEFDHKLPPHWWLGIFVVSVFFGLYYWTAHYTFNSLPSQPARFEAGSKPLADTPAAHGIGGAVTDDQELAVFHDSAQVAAGKQIFDEKCGVCHGVKAQGAIGPNLTDDYWLHGGKPSQIVATITNGVPEKGMVTWKGVLTDTEITAVAAYVLSIHGSKPSNPKAPQGTREAWTVP